MAPRLDTLASTTWSSNSVSLLFEYVEARRRSKHRFTIQKLVEKIFEIRHMSHVLGKANIAKTCEPSVHRSVATFAEPYADRNTYQPIACAVIFKCNSMQLLAAL